jgi:hypothetical protein
MGEKTQEKMKKIILGAIVLILSSCAGSEVVQCPCTVIKAEVHGSSYLLTVEGKHDPDDKDDPSGTNQFQVLYSQQRNIGDTLKFTSSLTSKPIYVIRKDTTRN